MMNWKSVILRSNETMEKAICRLNDQIPKIIMVADENGRLLGTVTDGDIRRGLILHLPMNTKIEEIMCKEPVFTFFDCDKESMFLIMKEKKILFMPIVDLNQKIVGLETLHYQLNKEVYDNPVVLMAGGFGKRLQPLTDSTPKPLLKVGNKSILEIILIKFINAGFYNFFISVHYKSEMIKEYFGDGSKWGINIEYVYEKTPLGTAGGLGLLPNNMTKLPVLIMNSDLLTEIDFQDLLIFHIQEKSGITMCVRAYDFQVPYGVIKNKGQRIISIDEKPIQKFFINAGIYVLDPSVLSFVNGKDFLNMPELIEERIKKSNDVNLYPMHENWLDVGSINDYKKASEYFQEAYEPI